MKLIKAIVWGLLAGLNCLYPWKDPDDPVLWYPKKKINNL